ncbi:uncharacterized protein [Palaemon carinicauda]|uniref:uncharacterized protein n=1 Tax=Palaemon carinicauda TaxID=392227 RepID=UPI0035B68D14
METSAFASKQHHEKAYETAWKYDIYKTIQNLGLQRELPLFIQAFVSHRFFEVRVWEPSIREEMSGQEKEIPQGSVLSVTLFALPNNRISSVIPQDILSTLFLYDLSISFAGKRIAMVERKLQLLIENFIQWPDMNVFKFLKRKTNVVYFCRIRGVHPDPDIYIKGQRIPCVNEARLSGLIFDCRLSWVPQLKALKVKDLQALNLLKVLSHTPWVQTAKPLELYKA